MTTYQQQHLSGIPTPPKPIKVLTQEESDQLLQYLQHGYLRDFLMVKLTLYTGLRNAELINLNVEDIAPFGDVATELNLPARAAKGGRQRTIQLRSDLTKDFTHFLLWKAERGENTGGHAPLFLTQKTALRLTTRDFQRILRKASRTAIHRDVHPHMLRHTFTTRVLRANDPKVAQQLLGHKSIYTTMIYDHPSTADHRRAVESIS